MSRHHVYIVRCTDESLYIGYARDPQAREGVHNAGKGARYTCGRRPVRLVYSESFETIGDALRREHELKRWSKSRKEALVASAQRRGGYRPVVARSRRRALTRRTRP
jgi:putative endonuclease